MANEAASPPLLDLGFGPGVVPDRVTWLNNSDLSRWNRELFGSLLVDDVGFSVCFNPHRISTDARNVSTHNPAFCFSRVTFRANANPPLPLPWLHDREIAFDSPGPWLAVHACGGFDPQCQFLSCLLEGAMAGTGQLAVDKGNMEAGFHVIPPIVPSGQIQPGICACRDLHVHWTEFLRHRRNESVMCWQLRSLRSIAQ